VVRAMKPVSDPALLSQLNTPARMPVSDPALLAELDGPTEPQKAPLVNRAANLGAAYVDSRTFGLGPKVAAGIGSAIAKPVLEGVEALGGKEAPAFTDLYKMGVDKYSSPGKQAFKDDPALAVAASVAGGLKSGKQILGTKAGAQTANWLRTGNAGQRIAKGALVAAPSGALYGSGTSDVGDELSGAAKGAAIGAIGGAAVPAITSALGSAVKGASNIKTGIMSRSIEDLDDAAAAIKQRSSDSYAKMRQIGAVLNPQSTQNVAQRIAKDLAADGNLNPKLHDKSLAMFEEIQDATKKGAIGLEDLDQWRQVLGDIAGNFSDKVNARKATIMIKAIDDVVENIQDKDLIAGGEEAIQALKYGRQEWARQSKFNAVTDIIRNADGDANKLKRDLEKFRVNPKKTRGWSDAEKEALMSASRQTTGEGALKLLGKFGFDLGSGRAVGNTALPVLGGVAGGIGTASVGPAMAIPAVGTVARMGQKALARGKAESLLGVIENGAPMQQLTYSQRMGQALGNSPVTNKMAKALQVLP